MRQQTHHICCSLFNLFEAIPNIIKFLDVFVGYANVEKILSPILFTELVTFDNMIARALALKDMDRTIGTVRTRFDLMFVTADRVKWAKKCKLLEAANAASGDEKADLIRQANEIQAAGRLIVGTKCANSAARGMHSAALAKKKPENEALKAPSHFKNRTKNIAFTNSDLVRKMHCGLLLRYNSEKIVY